MLRRLTASVSLIVFVLATLPGCGLIFGGTSQKIRVSTEPSGATVSAKPDIGTYTTPVEISLERRTERTIYITKPGYTDANFRLQRGIRGEIVLLDIVFGLVPFVIDIVVGSWYRLSPSETEVTLQKVAGDVAGPQEIRVAVSHAGGHLKITSPEPVSVAVR